jgi:hypothetical protein
VLFCLWRSNCVQWNDRKWFWNGWWTTPSVMHCRRARSSDGGIPYVVDEFRRWVCRFEKGGGSIVL